VVLDVPGEVGFHVFDRGDAVNEGRGTHEVGLLHQLHAAVAEFEAVGVERAPLVSDQDDAVEAVEIDEELELIDDALLLEVGLRVAGEAGRAAGERDAVVARQAQAVLEEVIKVLAHATIRAIDRTRTDAGCVIGDAAAVCGFFAAHAPKCTKCGIGRSLRPACPR
jgi:hypothetical protein